MPSASESWLFASWTQQDAKEEEAIKVPNWIGIDSDGAIESFCANSKRTGGGGGGDLWAQKTSSPAQAPYYTWVTRATPFLPLSYQIAENDHLLEKGLLDSFVANNGSGARAVCKLELVQNSRFRNSSLYYSIVCFLKEMTIFKSVLKELIRIRGLKLYY